MVTTLWAPEVVLGLAYANLQSAWFHRKAMEELANADGVEWGLAHAFYADMGGFVVSFEASQEQAVSSTTEAKINGAETVSAHESVKRPPSLPDVQSAGRPHGAQVEQFEKPFKVANCSPTRHGAGDVVQDETRRISNDSMVPAEKKYLRGEPMTADIEESTHGSLLSRQAHAVDGINRVSFHDVTGQNPSENDIRVRRMLKNQLNSRRGLAALREKNRTMSKWLGRIEWPVNHRNEQLVCDAVAGLEPSRITRDRYTAWCENAILLQGQNWVVDASQLCLARKMGILERLPNLTSDDLEDRSKGDALVKGFALLQIGWLVIQLIFRVHKRLPVSQLEIIVLAISACSLATYILMWSKPKDVRTHLVLVAVRYPTIEEVFQIAEQGPVALMEGGRVGPWIPDRSMHRYGNKDVNVSNTFALGTICGGLLFGSLHFIAWDHTFPTHAELLLWRSAAIITLVVPIVLTAANRGYRLLVAPTLRAHGYIGASDIIERQMGNAILSLYIVARLFVLVEVFRSLCFLPTEAYRTTWSANVPHVA